jgi:hypothetical protein
LANHLGHEITRAGEAAKKTISRKDAKTQRLAKKNFFILFAGSASLRETPRGSFQS